MAVASAIRRALATDPGSLLVFLPGMAEIRRVERQLRDSKLDPDVAILLLHGDLPQERQEEAIMPAPPDRRKVVLATSIAETSLTIEGVRVVIDAGLDASPTLQSTHRAHQAGHSPGHARFGGTTARPGGPAGTGSLLSALDGSRAPDVVATKTAGDS